MFDLKGKKSLITGSTQGIGRAIAKAFIGLNAEVIVHCSKDIDKAQKVANEIGAKHFCVYDLNEGNPQNLYMQTKDVDILVLNASVQYRKNWLEIDESEFDRQVNINLKSTLQLMQLYSRYMKEKKWGRILTIGSVQQYKPHKDMLVYAASKSAVMNMVINLAKQLAPYGVTVNNLSPGVINTPRNETALADKEYAKLITDNIPAGYTGNAEDCAGGAVMLCSEAGRYITGIDLCIDGGMRL